VEVWPLHWFWCMHFWLVSSGWSDCGDEGRGVRPSGMRGFAIVPERVHQASCRKASVVNGALAGGKQVPRFARNGKTKTRKRQERSLETLNGCWPVL
jgi:hypothetical protein